MLLQHIPLLSLANILFKANAINDALEIALVALQSSPDTVLTHFSIGNMYAAKVCTSAILMLPDYLPFSFVVFLIAFSTT